MFVGARPWGIRPARFWAGTPPDAGSEPNRKKTPIAAAGSNAPAVWIIDCHDFPLFFMKAWMRPVRFQLARVVLMPTAAHPVASACWVSSATGEKLMVPSWIVVFFSDDCWTSCLARVGL